MSASLGTLDAVTGNSVNRFAKEFAMTALTLWCIVASLGLNLALIAADGGRWGMAWQALGDRL